MSQDPISKNQQVYADRYGNQAPRTEGNPQPDGDYDTFDVPGIEGLDTLGGMEGMELDDISRGQAGEGLGDQDLISGMSEEEYIAHYRNNVAPQNRQEAEALMAEMGGQREGVFNAREALAELKTTLNKPENVSSLDTDTRSEMLRNLRELETLSTRPGVNPEEVQEKIEAFREGVEGALEEAKGTREEKISTMKGMVDRLLGQVESSGIPDEKKSEITSNLDSLKRDLNRANFNLKRGTETLEEIEKSFRREKTIEELKDKLETLPGRIPGEGNHNQESVELATMIARAVRSEDSEGWNEVNRWLAKYRTEDTNKPNNFIPQVIGTIFMDLAGSNEEKLNEFLSIIPPDIRELMAVVAPGDDANSTEHLNEPAKYKYYGRPNVTADRLRNSGIAEAYEHLGETEGTSEDSD